MLDVTLDPNRHPQMSRIEKTLWVCAALVTLFMLSPAADIVLTLLIWMVLGAPLAFALLAVPGLAIIGGAARLAYRAIRRRSTLPKWLVLLCLVCVFTSLPALPAALKNPQIMAQIADWRGNDAPLPAKLRGVRTVALVRTVERARQPSQTTCYVHCVELLVNGAADAIMVVPLKPGAPFEDRPVEWHFIRQTPACDTLRDQLAGQKLTWTSGNSPLGACLTSEPAPLFDADIALLDIRATMRSHPDIVAHHAAGISLVHQRSVWRNTSEGWEMDGQKSAVKYRTYAPYAPILDLQSTSIGEMRTYAQPLTIQRSKEPMDRWEDWVNSLLRPDAT